MRWVLSLLLCLVSLWAVGCGESTGTRLGVSGEVTLKGEPLDQGTISFYRPPDAKVITGGALILKGKYEIPVALGLEPGTYRVEISSLKAREITPEEYAAGKSPVAEAPQERIPSRYNTASQQFIEVKPGDPNRFDFLIE